MTLGIAGIIGCVILVGALEAIPRYVRLRTGKAATEHADPNVRHEHGLETPLLPSLPGQAPYQVIPLATSSDHLVLSDFGAVPRS